MNCFTDANVIYKAMGKAIKSGDRNRHITQLYQVNQLLYTAKLQKELTEGAYKPDSGHKFILKERGKIRYVTNNNMADKTVNHIVCDEILTPALQKYLIHDNGASQKGKGVSFHRRRFEQHLREYYRKHKTNEGYILLGDFSGYYANIRHDICSKVLAHFLKRSLIDKDVLATAWKILRGVFASFRVDVSRFSDDEIKTMYINKVEAMMNCGVDKKLLTGKKYLCKGVDIGNQASQNIGVVFPYRLDNYAKIVMGIRGYGRYTDDFYAIAKDKRTLRQLIEGLKLVAGSYGIIINLRKTRIVKLSSFYRHLQNGYSLTATGRVICKINQKSVTRQRRKIKAYKRLLDSGKITDAEVENICKSWICGNYKRMSWRQIYNISNLYKTLFRRKIQWQKKQRRRHGRLRWLMEHSSKSWGLTGTTS